MASRKNCDAVTAQRIRSALTNKGWNAQRLADETGISKSSISQYVNGYSAPSNINAGKIGKALGVSPAWLMGFGDDESKKVDDVVYKIFNAEDSSGGKKYRVAYTDARGVDYVVFNDKEKQAIIEMLQKMNGESIHKMTEYARFVFGMQKEKEDED